MTGDRVLAYRRRCLASGDSLSTVERGTRLLTFLAERWNLNLADGHPTHDEAILLMATVRESGNVVASTLRNYVRELNHFSKHMALGWHLDYPRAHARLVEEYLTQEEEDKVRALRWGVPMVDIRNRALISLAFSTGLRRAEICALTLDDLVTMPTGNRAIMVRRGKGDKPRTVYPDVDTWDLLDLWVTHHRPDTDPRALWTTYKGPLTYNGFGQLAVDIGAKAGIKRFWWHGARHRLIDNMIDAGVHLPTIQAMAGHVRPETTMSYVSQRQLRDSTEREALEFQARASFRAAEAAGCA
jgi:site-specific recombinase XerD